MGPGGSTAGHGSLIIIEFILWRKDAYLQPARTAKPDLRRHVATRGWCREGAAVSLGGVQLHCVCVCVCVHTSRGLMLFDRCCDLSWPPCTELLAAAQGTILKERAKSLCLFSRYICQKSGGKKWPPAASFMFEMLEDNHGVFPMHQKVCFSKSEQWDDFWNKQLVVNTLIVTFLMIKSICVFGALTESVSSFFFFFFFFFLHTSVAFWNEVLPLRSSRITPNFMWKWIKVFWSMENMEWDGNALQTSSIWRTCDRSHSCVSGATSRQKDSKY